MPDGIYNDVGMINSVIVLLDQLEVKGVTNMKIIFDCVNRLTAVQKSLSERTGGKQHAETSDR